jgi:hypothetical protein
MVILCVSSLTFMSIELFEKNFNATFIALIPKHLGIYGYGQLEVKDFRPISLVGSV